MRGQRSLFVKHHMTCDIVTSQGFLKARRRAQTGPHFLSIRPPSTKMSDSYTYKGSGTNDQVKYLRRDTVSNTYLRYMDRAITGAVATMEVLQATRTRIIIATVSIFHILHGRKKSNGPRPFRPVLLGDGSYYYSNPNGSTYYNSGTGTATYTAPDGTAHTSTSSGEGKSSGK